MYVRIISLCADTATLGEGSVGVCDKMMERKTHLEYSCNRHNRLIGGLVRFGYAGQRVWPDGWSASITVRVTARRLWR